MTEDPCTNLQITQNDIKYSKINKVKTENEDNSDPMKTENFNFEIVIVKTEPSKTDIETDYVFQDEHIQGTEGVEEILSKGDSNIQDKVVKKEYKYISENDDSEAENDEGEPMIVNATSTTIGNIKKIQNKNKSMKRYKCRECEKTFPTAKQLARHRVVHDERRYKCTTCSKTFIQFNHLRAHERTHTGEKPYACDVCHRAFNVASNLITHVRIHGDVRPFKCSVCGKAFVQSGGLTNHMRQHTGEKPFHCRFCSYQSARKATLIRHLHIHTGHKPYHCHLCPYETIQDNNLKCHMRTHQSQAC